MLPIKPTGKQYEDFVSAYLLAIGYFSESRLILTEGSAEICELDIIATPSGPDYDDRKILEAKSGSWGFADLFKVFGLMKYLEINAGGIVHKEASDKAHEEALLPISKGTNIKCHHLPIDGAEWNSIAEPSTDLEPELRSTVLAAAWLSQIAQRLALKTLDAHTKSNPSDLTTTATTYRRAVAQSSFKKDPLERVNALYNAYMAAPRLTGEFVRSLASGDPAKETSVWNAIDDSAERLWLQYITSLEMKARIQIIKNGLDHLLSKSSSTRTVDFGSGPVRVDELWKSAMPFSFRSALEKLAQSDEARRVPYLLQVFVELFGGFYRADNERDLSLLSRVTGIPPERVIPNLELMNEFFPMHKGWFFTIKGELTRMKFIPAFQKGIGCMLRYVVFGEDSYSSHYPQTGWILEKWHDAAYAVLKTELK